MILKTLTMGKSRKVIEGKNETWISARLEYEVNAQDYTIDQVEDEIEYILKSMEDREREKWNGQKLLITSQG